MVEPPEPPCGVIWRYLKGGQIIPFLGAGASLSGRPPSAEWDERTATFLPTGRELARHLAKEVAFPSSEAIDRDDLAKVTSYYVESDSRTGLVQRLQEVFGRQYEPGQIHYFLADLQIPLLIVTTNYDDLIEKAFTRRNKPFHLVVHPTDSKDLAASVLWWKPESTEPIDYLPAKLPLSLSDTTIIYKMHGSVDRHRKTPDSFVITEEDYVEFLARMTGQSAIPARFMLHFHTRRFLFLGYGLRDWNLRVMLKNLKGTLVDRPSDALDGKLHASVTDEGVRSWAIQYEPSRLEELLWRARKVNIYNMKIDSFVAKMREQMI
jgi:SIR2-like domain